MNDNLFELTEEPRDDAWLAERVRLLWAVHFADVPTGFPIVTRFGSRARYRFGSIAARDGKTIILINRLFADPCVPDYVVDATLAHELAHYAHGFGSGLPKLHRHAHRGGVVDRELEQRGLGELYAKAEKWRAAYWADFHKAQCGDLTERTALRGNETDQRWNALLERPDCRTEAELNGRLALLASRFGFSEESPPFRVAWLRASCRQNGLSYWYARERTVRLHGLLADRHVPGTVIDGELSYWLARQAVGQRWPAIRAAFRRAGVETVVEEAMTWRQKAWTRFVRSRHPLRPGK